MGCVLARGRVHLRQDFPGDAALVITAVMLNETGRYRCEVVDGLEDKSVSVDLELDGKWPEQCAFSLQYFTILLGTGV